MHAGRTAPDRRRPELPAGFPAGRLILAVLLVVLLIGPIATAAAQDAAGRNERRPAESTAPTFSELQSMLTERDLEQSERLELIRAAADRAPTVAVAVEVIRTHSESLEGPYRAQAIAAEAELRALSGNLEAAVAAYEDAAAAADGYGGDIADPSAYLAEAAALHLDMGDTETARRLAGRVIAEGRDPAVQRRAALIESRSLAAAGRLEDAFVTARSLSEAGHAPTLQPATLFFLHRLAQRLERPDEAQRARSLLEDLYPNSPEHMMITAEGVSEFPRPAAFLGFEAGDRPVRGEDQPDAPSPGDDAAETPRGVQVGSFRSTENARDMQRQMSEAGFPAEIRDSASGDYHRVVIPVDGREAARQLILELKEQGFEGFLVFED